MSFDLNAKQWKCGKGGAVNLQRVSSIVRDIGEPCLHQSPIKVVIAISSLAMVRDVEPYQWDIMRVLGTFVVEAITPFAFVKDLFGCLCKIGVMDWVSQSLHSSDISKMLKPDKWQATFDSDGKILGFQKVLKLIVLGGVDPSIRAEVWEFLLGCYTLNSTSEYRRQLRTARRERYRDLIKQCQMMHSSVGTGALAYIVGSKVMDMRTSSTNNGRKEAGVKSRRGSEVNTNKLDNYCHRDDSCIDTSRSCQKESSNDSGDLISVRGSTDGAAYDSSCFLPTSGPYSWDSPKHGIEVHGSENVTEDYFDFPPLPVTDLFEKNKKHKKVRRSKTQDDRYFTRRKLRFGDEHMHSFEISNNADLVVESNSFLSSDVSLPLTSETELAHLHKHDSVPCSTNVEYETDMLNGLRISDCPETPGLHASTSQGGAVNEDRVSEWLWTLHQIVVDVVRTDSHLEFYEDTRNLARMSDILAVYAWVDPATGYCQGMSDLLSPFVVLFEDNADAFWCFEMLLRRMRDNFQIEGPTGVMKQLQALWHVLEFTDKEMFSHLSRIGAESLHFAFRMLLVLFRRELSFKEALCMWEMMWAADFNESAAYQLEENCPELIQIQIPRNSAVELVGESNANYSDTSNGGLQSKHGNMESSISENTGMRSTSYRPLCGLTKNFWFKHDRTQTCTLKASKKNGDDELPVFCVAAILVMNRQKIIRCTHSIDDLIKIFNDRMLKIRVKRCVQTAIKLRKKYFYKLIK